MLLRPSTRDPHRMAVTDIMSMLGLAGIGTGAALFNKCRH